MTSSNPIQSMEEKLHAATRMPEPRPEFLVSLRIRLAEEPQHSIPLGERLRTYFLRPAWAISLIVLVLVAAVFFVAGPGRVFAAVRGLFGYIPGVGIVDQSTPIRMLAEPVSVTREGIIVSVNLAILTASETRLDFGVSGVPLSAYPKGEAESGCIEREYLRLPDGAKIDVNSPIAPDVNEATFVLPCIFNTLPGAAPTDWELLLRFVSAPADMTVLPVIEITPNVTPTEPLAKDTLALETESPTVAANVPSTATISVEKVIETEDGYILIGSLRPQVPEGSWMQVTGPAIIRDAGGQKVSYSFPNDVQPVDDPSLGQGGFPWAFQIKSAGLTFPLTISFSGVVISQVDPQASAQIAFDAGPSPQPNQEWNLNQDVQLAGNTVRLVSITANSDGYSFRVDPGPHLSDVSVQISGYQATGGGGGGAWGGTFNTSLIYSELPKGQLTILFSNPLSASATGSWHGQWQPDAPHTVAPVPADGSSSVCLNANTFQTLKPLPAGLDGKMLITELNPELQIVLASLDGTQQQVLASGSSRGALTQDGARLTYPTDESITIKDLASGEISVLKGIQGRDLHWSPDGTQIAYVTAGDIYGVFVISKDGQNVQQLSNLGYESIAGWSPDNKQLYYAIPSASGTGFLLRSVNVNTGDTRDLFVLEDSSRKAPMPAVSPDGKWVAYRASDNTSLYLKGLDGSPARLLLENPATAINGIAWEKEGHLLGVSLITPENPDGEIILMQPDNCETYRVFGFNGELEGVLIP